MGWATAQVVFPGNLDISSKGQNPVATTGQAVRVMVWLGLESWSTRSTGQAVTVTVWLGLVIVRHV